MKINYLSVSVFRDSHGGDCSNNGISSRFRELKVYCPDGPHSFDSETETPLNFCMVRHHDYASGHYCELVPACVKGKSVTPRPHWYMFGGNIGYTCDSRFTSLAGCNFPLKIHDRRE